MKHFLQKYLSRRLFLNCLLFLLLLAIPFVLINNFLKRAKPNIEQSASEFTGNTVSIRNISYLPPAHIIVRGIVMQKTNKAGLKPGEPLENKNETMISIKKMALTLSLLKLITKRQLSLSSIVIEQPRFDYAECFAFVKENFEKIKAFINSLPEDKVNILLKKALFYFVYGNKNMAYVDGNIAIEARGSSIAIAGVSGLEIKAEDKKIFSSSPLQYALRLHLSKSGLLIDSVEFARNDLYAKLWGHWENRALRLNCITILSPVFDLSRAYQIIPGTKKNITFYLKNPLSRTYLKYPPGSSLMDASLTMRAMDNAIKIENLFFTIKNTPFRIKGEIILTPEINFDLTLSSYPSFSRSDRLKNPKMFDLTLQGGLMGKKFTGKTALGFLKNNSPITIAGDFKNAGIDFSKEKKLSFSCDELGLTYPSENGLSQIPFHNFSALISTSVGKIMPTEIHSALYDGTLKAVGYLDKASPLSKNSFRVNLTDVEANKLSSVLIHLSKVYGRATADIAYQSYPKNRLSGTVYVLDGRVENFEFLKWLANFFALPQLSQIHFKQLSTSFSVDDKTAKLENTIMDSTELPLRGYFYQTADNFVTSKISLQLNRGLLEASEKFKPILNILGEGFSFLDFDFQLSGSIHKMNFMWLDSEFKNKLKARIPNFIERGIERKIEASLKTPPENKQEPPLQAE